MSLKYITSKNIQDRSDALEGGHNRWGHYFISLEAQKGHNQVLGIRMGENLGKLC